MWACSDDDDDPVQLEVNNGVSSVSINRLGGEISVPISSNGSWTVAIDDEENDWAGTLVAKGNGNGAAVISVDYFSPEEQKAERTVSFTIKTADNSSQLNVRQYIGLNDGEEAPNDNNDTGITDAWFSKAIGCGFDPVTGKVTGSCLFNAKTLAKYSGNDEQYISVTKIPGAGQNVVTTDTLEVNDKTLKVKLSINVKYAKFKLSINGDYDNSGKQIQNNKTYCVSQEMTFETAQVNAPNIVACIEDNPTFNNDVDTMAAKITQNGFQSKYKTVTSVYASGDKAKFKSAVHNVLRAFGPLVVIGSSLGGSIFTAIEYDSVAVANDMKLKGVVDGNVKIAAVSVDAGLDATYTSLGQDIWKNSNHKCTITGGSTQTINALLKLVRQDEFDRTEYSKAVDDWQKSLSNEDKPTDKCHVIKYDLTPIWYFFPFDMQDEMRDIALEYYNGKKLCVDLKEDFTTYQTRK